MNIRLLGFGSAFHASTLHPAVVHFPLVLVPISFVLFAGGHLGDSAGVRLAGRVCLGLAVVSAMIAMFTGAVAAGDLAHDAALWELYRAHRALAFVAVFLTAALSGWSAAHVKHRPRAIWAFLAVLGLDCALILQTGDLGARMVYGHGAAVKAAPPAAAAPRLPQSSTVFQ